jgi:hypothetical protein
MVLEKYLELWYIFVSYLCKTYALIYLSSLFTFMHFICMISIVIISCHGIYIRIECSSYRL